jgi:hypothetical protein
MGVTHSFNSSAARAIRTSRACDRSGFPTSELNRRRTRASLNPSKLPICLELISSTPACSSIIVKRIRMRTSTFVLPELEPGDKAAGVQHTGQRDSILPVMQESPGLKCRYRSIHFGWMDNCHTKKKCRGSGSGFQREGHEPHQCRGPGPPLPQPCESVGSAAQFPMSRC